MKNIITKIYLALLTGFIVFGFSIRWYQIWSSLYAFLFLKKNVRKRVLSTITHSSGGPARALDEVLKVPYRSDTWRQLWDVCQPAGRVQQYIDDPDIAGPMDCDEYARYLAVRLDDTEYIPKILSIMWVNKEDMSMGVFPKINGHAVCTYTCPLERNKSIDIDIPQIYHIGNWNRGSGNNALGPKHYGFRNLRGLAKDIVGNNQPLCWAVMDCDLKICTWGTGLPPDWCAIEFERIRPISLLG